MNQHIGEIQYCYERQVHRDPSFAGRVVFEWKVAVDGRVAIVKVAMTSLTSSDATACMMAKIRAWRFPKPEGGAFTVSYPFVFQPL